MKKLFLLLVAVLLIGANASAQFPPPPPGANTVYVTVTEGTSGSFTFDGETYACGRGTTQHKIQENESGISIPNVFTNKVPTFTVNYSNLSAGTIVISSDQEAWCFEGPWTVIDAVYIMITVVPDLSSFSLSTASGFSPIVACDFYNGSTKYHDGSGSYPVLGDKVYSSSAGAAFDGQNRWFKLVGTDDVIKIDSTGEVVMEEECLGGGPQH